MIYLVFLLGFRILCVHNRSDRTRVRRKQKAPPMRGFSFFHGRPALCRAAWFFVHRVLQKKEFLPYGAIDCIAVNRCV